MRVSTCATATSGRGDRSAKLKWTATSVDLILQSTSELRAVAEAYGSDDARERFVKDFGKAWTNVWNLDRI